MLLSTTQLTDGTDDGSGPVLVAATLGGWIATAALATDAANLAAGLVLVDALLKNKALRQYHWLPSVRGDLLARLGRDAEACAEFERAAAMAGNERERTFLLERAMSLR